MPKIFLFLMLSFLSGLIFNVEAADSLSNVELFKNNSNDKNVRLVITPRDVESADARVDVINMSLFVDGRWVFSNVDGDDALLFQKSEKWTKIRTWSLEDDELESLTKALESSGEIPVISSSSFEKAENSVSFIQLIKNTQKLKGTSGMEADIKSLRYLPSFKMSGIIAGIVAFGIVLKTHDFGNCKLFSWNHR